MAHSIQDYLSEESKVSYYQLLNRFGDPKRVCETYLTETEMNEIIVHLKTGRRIERIVLAATAVALTLWVGCTVMSYMNVHRGANGYAIVEVIEIEQEENGE